MLKKRLLFVLMIVALILPALAVTPLAGAQEEMPAPARVRVGYFAFDPKDYDTYVDGELFPFAGHMVSIGWSIPVDSIHSALTASPFFDFSDGIHSFAIVPQSEGLEHAILGPKEVTLEAGHAYSLAIVGSLDADNLDLLVIDDTQILAGTDPRTAFVSIIVNNIAGIPAFEMEGENEEVVGYGQFFGGLLPVNSFISLSVYATTGDQRNLLFVDSASMAPGLSDFGAIFGSYPGVLNEDYFYAVNFGYAGQITVLDGGAIEVGNEAAGEIAAVTQRVRYTLALRADTALSITVSGTGLKNADTIMPGVGTFDPAVYVFDPEGKLLVWSEDVSLQDYSAKLEGITLKAGTYGIEVGGSYDLVSGPFKLSVENAASD